MSLNCSYLVMHKALTTVQDTALNFNFYVVHVKCHYISLRLQNVWYLTRQYAVFWNLSGQK